MVKAGPTCVDVWRAAHVQVTCGSVLCMAHAKGGIGVECRPYELGPREGLGPRAGDWPICVNSLVQVLQYLSFKIFSPLSLS